MPEHLNDKGFKREFSRKKYFLHFLKHYVGLPVSKDLSLDDLHLEENEHQGARLNRLESDLVYRVQNKENIIYFYVDLELQTKVDFTMPMRMFLYMSELIRRNFEDVNKSEREEKEYRPPAVIPSFFTVVADLGLH